MTAREFRKAIEPLIKMRRDELWEEANDTCIVDHERWLRNERIRLKDFYESLK